MPSPRCAGRLLVFLLPSLPLVTAVAQPASESSGSLQWRGAPLAAPLPVVPEDPSALLNFIEDALADERVVGPLRFDPPGPVGTFTEPLLIGTHDNGGPPPGITALPIDLFTTRDFYADKLLWRDPRYFRCNSGFALEQQRGASTISSATIGDNPPYSAAWGRCDADYPRAAIVSPYPFTSAAAHYDALMADARNRGGPTRHTYATVPGEWSGRYGNVQLETTLGNWYGMLYSQVATIVSLLTEEYQQRYVQQAFHEVNTNAAQWPSQYCQPEGFMRRWHAAAVGEHYVLVTPSLVQILTGVADNFMTSIHVGRAFNRDGSIPRLGADVPRWYGETIGFWDDDVLVTWTSNIQGWTVHSAFEFSGQLQTIEVYSPIFFSDGRFRGLRHEAVFYDPEALVEPIRIVRNLEKLSSHRTGPPFVYIECIQTLFPVNGRATPVAPGTAIELVVPDIYGRPWAQTWEKYWEEGMQRPSTDSHLFRFDQR